ncbi:MAG: hypothetical protein HYZ52_02680 [Candidatus Omnitrophica bacterium]|nr:hypothetical protein [Candidatus Omnitrophota bacterium]
MAGLILAGFFIGQAGAKAGEADSVVYSEINLNHPEKTAAITLSVPKKVSEIYHWKPGRRMTLRAVVERAGGKKEFIRDTRSQSAWQVVLDARAEATLAILPDKNNFSGEVTGVAEGKSLKDPEAPVLVLVKTLEYEFADGAKIKVHFTDQILDGEKETAVLARETLDAAVAAYQTIAQFNGFNTPGYAFADPDRAYAYDPDKTIDIYLGSPSEARAFHGFSGAAFRDAPCFDTVKLGEHIYQAAILLPANYRVFIKNWEALNPSALGARSVEVDLRGTLIHEMLHTILFYYNKNLNKEENAAGRSENGAARKVDWYVEGLARYFETFAGARHDFFSQGFKQTLVDKIRFSRGGSNFFMRYPDQAFVDLRYENALFWRFMDYRYGMGAIEKLSRDFRGGDREDFKRALEKVTGVSFNELLGRFAMSILLKDFGLKEDEIYLKDIGRTRLVCKTDGFYLKDGYGEEKFLGQTCSTDWIGEWGQARARQGEPPAAGDNTPCADVAGWATDFYEVEVKETSGLPWIGVRHLEGGRGLDARVVLVSKGGSFLIKNILGIRPGALQGFSLQKFLEAQGLTAADLEKVYILVTNTDAKTSSDYEILAHFP